VPWTKPVVLRPKALEIFPMPEEHMTITGPCMWCRQQQSFEVSIEGFKKWKGGQLAQVAMPELTPDQREFLISQTCGKCFDSIMGDGK